MAHFSRELLTHTLQGGCVLNRCRLPFPSRKVSFRNIATFLPFGIICKAFSTKKASEQYWLYLLWKTLYDAGVLFGFEGKTTGIKNLLFDDFCAQYRIVAPDETILQKFHEVVSPIFDKIQQYNIENDELTRLRDWLLPMLMNGQATVE